MTLPPPISLGLSTSRKLWHVVGRDSSSRCGAPVAGKVERGFDARTIQYRGKRVCARCLAKGNDA